MVERIMADLRRARAQGRRLRRPRASVPIERVPKVAGLGLEEAAHELGVSRSTVKRWRQVAKAKPCCPDVTT